MTRRRGTPMQVGDYVHAWLRCEYIPTLCTGLFWASLHLVTSCLGSTKRFVSYGGFTHVGFPSHTFSVYSNYQVTTFPSSSLCCSPLFPFPPVTHSVEVCRT